MQLARVENALRTREMERADNLAAKRAYPSAPTVIKGPSDNLRGGVPLRSRRTTRARWVRRRGPGALAERRNVGRGDGRLTGQGGHRSSVGARVSITTLRTAEGWWVGRDGKAFPVDVGLPTTAALVTTGLTAVRASSYGYRRRGAHRSALPPLADHDPVQSRGAGGELPQPRSRDRRRRRVADSVLPQELRFPEWTQ